MRGAEIFKSWVSKEVLDRQVFFLAVETWWGEKRFRKR